MNKISMYHRSLRDLLKITSHEEFHSYLIESAIQRYRNIHAERKNDLGSVLAVCANFREALAFRKFPFERILLTGLAGYDKTLKNVVERDSRITYQQQNCERISLNSQTFDLVFCKEGLHHLARPVLGLYEMLRVCRKAVIIIEPCDTFLGSILKSFNLRSSYETDNPGNMHSRSNFVYNWNKRQLRSILNSYYLESGYHLHMTLGWMSSRYNAHRSKLIRRAVSLVGWGIGFVPGCYGNYMTALILPGSDIPPDPVPVDQAGDR